jgi:YfiH family protein
VSGVPGSGFRVARGGVSAEPLDLFRFQNLAAQPWLVHGISGRAGGVSEGRFCSLNVSFTVGDERARVEENLRRLREALGCAELFSAYQVHGNAVTLVDGQTQPRPRCDVLITRSPERALMLRFADCTPVLLADPRQRAVAAVHAGWRGSAVRAAGAAVQAMADAFGSRPRDLLAGIGPAIGPCCYTVGADVQQAFLGRHEHARDWLHVRGAGQPHLDLVAANRALLSAAGVRAIESAGVCTACHVHEFYSARAEQRRNGCFGAAIVLNG